MPQRTDQPKNYREHLISRSAFAEHSGRSRSSITEACQGPLAAAVRGNRIDAAHPAAVAWARKRKIDPEQLLEPTTRLMLQQDRRTVRRPRPTLTYQEVAKRTGVSVEEVRAGLAAAEIPAAHVDAEQLAFFAGCTVDEVFDAVDAGELSSAIRDTGYIDLSDQAVVAFAARRPFRDDLSDAPDAYLAPAMLSANQVDAAHPVAIIFMARCLGHVPSAAELASQ
ncbi:MAG TPA: hypothetical protein VMI54_15800 [Polyangiaceae bacterium]|nr:hypothetical protein [Polyangiaceae bacterium]